MALRQISPPAYLVGFVSRIYRCNFGSNLDSDIIDIYDIR